MWKFLGLIISMVLGGYLVIAFNIVQEFNFFEENPTIVIGLSAALVALIGVFFSNLNIDKSIKSSRKNLQKQLDAQTDIFKGQLQHQKELQDAQLRSDQEKRLYENHKQSQKEMFQSIVELCSFIESYINESFYFNQARINYRYFYTINDTKAEIFEKEQDDWLKTVKESNASIEKAKSIIAFQHYINEVGSIEIYNKFTQKMMLIEQKILEMNMLGDFFIESDICVKSTELTLLNLRELRASTVQFFKEEIFVSLYLELLSSIKEPPNTSMNLQ